MKILIAEDDIVSRQILAAILKKNGHEVVEVENGFQALEELQKKSAPRLAILDWMMPGLDGVGVCSRLQLAEVPDPPYLIILTALEDKKDIVRALRAGAHDYIIKPYAPNELLARVSVGCRVIELQKNLVQRIKDLQNALKEIRMLQGILPICMHCHKIRTDKESWQRLESYISEHSDAKFSHGICPECAKKYFKNSAPVK